MGIFWNYWAGQERRWVVFVKNDGKKLGFFDEENIGAKYYDFSTLCGNALIVYCIITKCSMGVFLPFRSAFSLWGLTRSQSKWKGGRYPAADCKSFRLNRSVGTKKK